MHHPPARAVQFFEDLDLAGISTAHELILFPPAVSLWAAHRCPSRPARVALGAQNVDWRPDGAVTGALSAKMAVLAGASYVLVGHSERRSLFGETGAEIARKAQAVLAAGATPVVCVGEALEERRAGAAEQVVHRQLNEVLPVLSGAGAGFLVAYEPVWAIGTGETATPQDAEKAHAAIRVQLAEDLGSEVASAVSLLYGGSVKPENAGELMSAPDVDGVLVGGGSLDPRSFAEIARAAPASIRSHRSGGRLTG